LHRRRLIIAALIACGLVLFGFLAVLVLYPRVAAWAIREKVLTRLETRFDREIRAGTIRVGRGTAVLEDISVSGAADLDDAPLARIERITVEFDFWATLGGDIRVHRVTIEGARALAVRHAEGSDNISDIAEALGQRSAGGDAESRGARVDSLRPDVLVIRDAALEVRDLAAGVSMHAADIDASVPRDGQVEASMRDIALSVSSGPRARAALVTVVADIRDPVGTAKIWVEEGEIAAHGPVSLSSINGAVQRADSPGRLLIDLGGSYGGATQRLWQARGWVEPLAGRASVRIAAERFTFDRLDSILRDSAVIDYRDTAVGAEMDIDMADGKVTFAGTVQLTGGNIYHPMLAETPLRQLDGRGGVQGSFDLRSRTLRVDRAELHARGIEYRVEGFYSMRGGIDPESGARREFPRLGLHLIIPPVPCQTMLEGLPDALKPYLAEFKLRGTFRTDVKVAIDWADLDATVLSGSVGIFGCKVLREPEGDYGLSRLDGTFTHYVEADQDQWIELLIGPENPDFVPLGDVSPHLLSSLMTTEDARFYHHRGFIVREFRTALIKNLEAGYFRYGASSITMQTVKNVILYREKTLARKLQELFLTWYIETKLDKDRIFEIYVNAIEYGPGLYGIGPAAQHYFGKHPRDLNPVEAAFFSSILPSPKRRYQQYCEDRLWRATETKIQRILKLMHKRERLTNEEYAAALETPLVFDRKAAPPLRECKRMVKHAIENARPTNPMKR
jgi:hypothetical protein